MRRTAPAQWSVVPDPVAVPCWRAQHCGPVGYALLLPGGSSALGPPVQWGGLARTAVSEGVQCSPSPPNTPLSQKGSGDSHCFTDSRTLTLVCA